MMLTKEKITDILSEKSEYLASEYRVKRIGLFGSYAKETSTEASDIDTMRSGKPRASHVSLYEMISRICC